MIRISCIALLLSGLIGCTTFAPPSPLMTFGGPKTVQESHSEAAVAVGTGFGLFPGAHSGAMGWFGRYKRGVTDKFDLGVDAVGVVRSDKGTLTAKVAGRYQLRPRLRLELGLGAADDSDGKSLNGDIGLTVGTIDREFWNYYASLRLGAAKGYPGNIFGTGDIAPTDALFPIINFGAQGNISKNQEFVYEGGFGYIIPRASSAGALIYLSCGLLFDIGK
ncbi:MAG TPA: hypothetical protein VIS48_11605 [Candidatus Kryptonia bacterium]